MRPTLPRTLFVLLLFSAGTLTAFSTQAHFQMIIPSDDMVKQGEGRTLNLDLRFWHPLEGLGMHVAPPVQFGVIIHGERQDLRGSLKPQKSKDRTGALLDTFAASYTMKKPGNYVFFVEPQPYWEAAEEKFIVHYTKVIVNGFGLEEGWDTDVGAKTEIVPLTRPYGLWSGNVFQGIVKVNGQPAPYTDVEVEYYDSEGKVKPPADPMITQVIKADSNGVFTYAMPWGGWWGFAALNEDNTKMQHEGKEFPVEIGAVLWVKTHDRP